MIGIDHQKPLRIATVDVLAHVLRAIKEVVRWLDVGLNSLPTTYLKTRWVVIIPVLDSYLEIRQIVSTMEAILGGGLNTEEFQMIISELLQELTGRAQNAQVIVVENGSTITIESVAKQEQESQKVVFLIGEAVKSPMVPRASRFLAEAMAQGVSKRFSAKIVESVHNPAKFQVSVDGTPLSTEFDTQDEARAYMQGFTIGFSVGGGIRGMAKVFPLV